MDSPDHNSGTEIIKFREAKKKKQEERVHSQVSESREPPNKKGGLFGKQMGGNMSHQEIELTDMSLSRLQKSEGSSNSSLNEAGSDELDLTKKQGRGGDSSDLLRNSVDSLHFPEIIQHRDYGGFNFGDHEDIEGTKGGLEGLKEAIQINLNDLDTSRLEDNDEEAIEH